MRVSHPMLMQDAMRSISQSYETLGTAQERVGTGKRITKPSDDPAGTALMMSMRTTLSQIDQYRRNIADAKGYLSTTDGALSQATDIVRRVRSLAVASVNDALSVDARNSLAIEIGSDLTALGNIANVTYSGRSIFAGQRTDKPAFDMTDGKRTYQGGSAKTGDGDIVMAVSPTEDTAVNVTGDVAFSPAMDALAYVKRLIGEGKLTQVSNDGLQKLDAALQGMLSVRADVGSRLQAVEQTDIRLEDHTLNLTEIVSKVEDVDMGQAVLDLKSAEMTYEAALAASSRGMNQSLLDYLR